MLFILVVGPLALLDRRGTAVLVGWLSHLLLDSVHVVVNVRPEHLTFLGWPVLHANSLGLPPGEFVFHYLWSPSFLLEVGIWCVVGYLTLTQREVFSRTLREWN